ncbi:uncharacterized protein [Bemisia tabaci]|uniref:uncharacterized protein n=1 Tax=Bemisia tabaci TaxID=7038 RepID=UPI003B283F30
MQTIEGPALLAQEPGSNKLFDIYNTTNTLTYHLIDREAVGFYNAPLANYSPLLPERGAMRDVAVFPHPTIHRIPRTSFKSALKMTDKSETKEKYSTPWQPVFETPIPRHMYLEEWNNKHVRCLTAMYLSEYNSTIANKAPAAINLLKF